MTQAGNTNKVCHYLLANRLHLTALYSAHTQEARVHMETMTCIFQEHGI